LFSLVLILAPEQRRDISFGAPRLSNKHQSILKRDSLVTNYRVTCRPLIRDDFDVGSAGSAVVLKPEITMRIRASSSELSVLDLRPGFFRA
jgi:hypothetical protein